MAFQKLFYVATGSGPSQVNSRRRKIIRPAKAVMTTTAATETVKSAPATPQKSPPPPGTVPLKVVASPPAQSSDQDPPSDPQRIVSEIEAASKRVSEKSTTLSKRILAFENWLNSLPGRVETSFWDPIAVENDAARIFGLFLTRSGKQWALLYAYHNEINPNTPNWSPLADASVDTKLRAMRSFPKFLRAIRKTQEKREAEIEAVATDFDEFAEALGIKGEGK